MLKVDLPQGVCGFHEDVSRRQIHLEFILPPPCGILKVNLPQGVCSFHVDVSSGQIHLKFLLPLWNAQGKSSLGVCGFHVDVSSGQIHLKLYSLGGMLKVNLPQGCVDFMWMCLEGKSV